MCSKQLLTLLSSSTEGVNGQRALGFQQPGGDTNTVENCISTCIGLNYTVAGLEYSSQCFCDNDLYNGASKTAESNCNMPCAGNSTEMCGAGNILSIYNTGNLTIFQPPASQNSSLPGNWTYEVGFSAHQWQLVADSSFLGLLDGR